MIDCFMLFLNWQLKLQCYENTKIYCFDINHACACAAVSGQQAKQNYKLHIIIIGAHPDDPDKVGGTAYKWAQAGHDVLMVSLTNGDAGHQTIPARRTGKNKKRRSPKGWRGNWSEIYYT